MLSVGRSANGKEGRRLGFGGRGGMEENGVEDGEACDDSLIDPDVALSYIDEKLQDVLGHIQRDFEGGVSAENLGAKFGGYGSFLPTYQRSPLVVQKPRSPPKEANHNASRSPYNLSLGGEHQTPLVVIPSSKSRSNLLAIVPAVDDPHKNDNCTSMCSERMPLHQDDSLSKPVNGNDQKTLKVRIKVGSDNILARNKAAIYSGLGLDVSPSSSLEDSSDASDGLSTEFCDMHDESPETILQIMTWFSVPGGVLLSPLRGSLLELTEKAVPLLKKNKTSMFSGSAPGPCEVSSDTTPVKRKMMKIRNHDEKKGLSADVKNSRDINYTSAISSSDIDVDISSGQDFRFDHLNRQFLSNSRTVNRKEDFPGESVKESSRMLEYSKETEGMLVKDNTSMPETVGDKPELVELMESSDADGHRKEKLKYKIRPVKSLKGEKMTSHRDCHFDLQKESKAKVENFFDTENADLKGYNMVKDQIVRIMDNVISSDKAISHQRKGGNGKPSEEKAKQQGNHSSAAPLLEFSENMMVVQSYEIMKEKKKVSHARADQRVKKSKAKFHDKLGSDVLKESHEEVMGDATESGTGLLEVQHREKLKIMYPESEKESVTSRETSKETGSRTIDKYSIPDPSFNEPLPMPSALNDTAAAPSAPVVIEEHWVCCDICQKWRLLPYGSNPDNLPKKWHCSLLNWLPGLNRCDISEEETTKALNALYLAPASELGIVSGGYHDVASSSKDVADGVHLSQRLDYTMQGNTTTGKKKHGRKNGAAVAINSNAANSAKKNPQPSMGNKILCDVNQHPFETNSLTKAGLGHGSESMDLTVEKQKIKHKKHKNLGCYSDGGSMEKSNSHSKLKSKRVISQDDSRAFKKIKKEDSHDIVRDRNNEYDVDGMVVPDMSNVSSAKAMAKSVKKQRKVSSCKEKFELKENLSASRKRFKDEDEDSLKGESKEYFSRSGVERSDKLDFSTKRRKVKEWQEIQHCPAGQLSSQHVVGSLVIAKQDLSKKEALKEKKLKISKSELKVFKGDVIDENGHAAGTDSSSRGHSGDRIDKDRPGKEKLLDKRQRHPPYREALGSSNYLKRDSAYAQASMAATSSSSKISGSWKNQVSFLEARGSPVGSVSSSPLRNCNSDTFCNKKNLDGKNEVLNVGSSVLGSPKGFSDIELDWENNCNGKSRKGAAYLVQQVLESPRSGESGLLGSSRKALHDEVPRHEAEEVKVTGDCRSLLHLEGKYIGEYDVLGKRECDVKFSHLGRNRSCSDLQENLVADGPSTDYDQPKNINSRVAAKEVKCGVSDHEKNKPFLSLRADKQGTQSRCPQVDLSPAKEGKSEVYSTEAVNLYAPSMVKQSRKPNILNEVQHKSSRQSTPSPLDTSSQLRKDSHPAANTVLKEARDLKHMANRLKNEGLELESTGLYFEAALKFLHVASLLEPLSFDSSKLGDTAQSMQMYSETAKLCEFCAHEYERYKEMAAAALAFKCVEVAHLKAAYYKYPGASKDRNELQISLQMVPPGESPSSSASDVDSLNNQSTLGKAALVKGANSPQVAGNHVIAARHRPYLLRLLNYTNDLNCAFEATRKSQIAVAAAEINLQKDGSDGIASVKRVLDFNFHDVKGLLRLVRLSLESISH